MWQNRRERPNRSTNNGYFVNKDKRDIVSESVTSRKFREADLLKVCAILDLIIFDGNNFWLNA